MKSLFILAISLGFSLYAFSSHAKTAETDRCDIVIDGYEIESENEDSALIDLRSDPSFNFKGLAFIKPINRSTCVLENLTNNPDPNAKDKFAVYCYLSTTSKCYQLLQEKRAEINSKHAEENARKANSAFAPKGPLDKMIGNDYLIHR